ILQRIIDEKVVEVFEDIKSRVRKMCDLRSGPNASIPVIIHGYAYITPREAPARLFSWGEGVRGPWLKKKLDDLSIHDPAVQKTLAVRVIDRMNEFYRTQIAEPVIDGVHYVDLRPLVIEAQL